MDGQVLLVMANLNGWMDKLVSFNLSQVVVDADSCSAVGHVYANYYSAPRHWRLSGLTNNSTAMYAVCPYMKPSQPN